jgi:hypothetical protein
MAIADLHRALRIRTYRTVTKPADSRHQQFLEKNKANGKTIGVFDAYAG